MIQIEQMNVSLPGINEEQGHEFGRDIALRVAEGLQGRPSHRELIDLKIQVELPEGLSNTEFVESISVKIIQQLSVL